MSRRFLALTVLAAVVCISAGCADDGFGDGAPSPAPGDDGLKLADCIAPQGETSYREVWCTDPTALASITKVESTGAGIAGALAGADCPDGTDIALSTSNFSPASRLNQRATFGYACARNVTDPHPGDPGEGGGPDIIVGDCVWADKDDKVSEVRCDGKGEHKPTYEVTDISVTSLGCGPTTDVTFPVGQAQVGNPLARETACAKKL